MKGMALDSTLRAHVKQAMHDRRRAEAWKPTLDDLADAALAVLGLDDWEAAVDRGGNALADECQDRYGFRMALGQRDILAEVVLRAALSPTETSDE